MPDSDLRVKYGAGAFDIGNKIQPQSFDERVAERDSLDQHFTQLWLDFAISGMSARPALDARTRLLVLVGQYTMAKSHPALADTVRAALAANVAAREILEIILLEWLDKMDSGFADLWVKFCCMYARGVVDDKTRLRLLLVARVLPGTWISFRVGSQCAP